MGDGEPYSGPSRLCRYDEGLLLRRREDIIGMIDIYSTVKRPCGSPRRSSRHSTPSHPAGYNPDDYPDVGSTVVSSRRAS